MKFHTTAIAGFATLALSVAAFSTQAASLVTNGSFESTNLPSPDTSGLVTNAPTVVGWNTSSGFSFVTNGDDASATYKNPSSDGNIAGMTGPFGPLYLWNGLNGGTTPAITGSPDGGNFLASDGAYRTGPIYQSINGLVIGETYKLSFYQAASQQHNYFDPTTDQWQVSLGNQTKESTLMNVAPKSFVPWTLQTMFFTADSTSALLSFLAQGTPPEGAPPFSLLDGVVLVPTPIPAAAFFVIPALAGVFGFARRKRNEA